MERVQGKCYRPNEKTLGGGNMVKGELDFINYFKTPEPGEDMECEGEYDMPKLQGIRLKNPDKGLKIVAFNEAYRIPKSKRKQYIVEFFIADYLFERVWSRLNPITEFLKDFKAVMSPDFSQYLDMPRAMCIWQQYRRMFVSWYWQQHGIIVIPVIGWTDKKSYEYCWAGFPQNSCVVISSVNCWKEDFDCEKNSKKLQYEKSILKDGTENLISQIKPAQIIWYGKLSPWIEKTCKENSIELIPLKAHYCKRFNHDYVY